MLNLPGGKFIVLTLMVLVLGVVVGTIQLVSLAEEVERLDKEMKRLSRVIPTAHALVRAQREEQEKLQREAKSEREELKNLVARLSEQVEMMEGRVSTLDSSVTDVKIALDRATPAVIAQQQQAEALPKLLAASEKATLRELIREELEEGHKKQVNTLMNLFGNRLLDQLAKELNLTDQQKAQIDEIVRDTMQTMIRMWSEGAAKNPREVQAGIGMALVEANYKIKAVLTAEQNTKYDRMVRRRMESVRRIRQEVVEPPKTQEPSQETY